MEAIFIILIIYSFLSSSSFFLVVRLSSKKSREIGGVGIEASNTLKNLKDMCDIIIKYKEFINNL